MIGRVVPSSQTGVPEADPRSVEPSEAASNGAIPPLENGDRLTRVEFEQRYDAMPNLKDAELLEGIVYLRLTTRHRQHAAAHAKLCGWLGTYEAFTPGVEAGNSSHVRLDGGIGLPVRSAPLGPWRTGDRRPGGSPGGRSPRPPKMGAGRGDGPARHARLGTRSPCHDLRLPLTLGSLVEA